MDGSLEEGERLLTPHPVYGAERITAVGGYGRVIPLAEPYVVPPPGGIVHVAIDLGRGTARVVSFQPRGDF